jgi:parvin
MTSNRPKSPRTPTSGKDDSFWDKIGTLGRKKRIKEGKCTAQSGCDLIFSKFTKK